MKLHAIVASVAIVSITVVECFAIQKGIDGKFLSLAFAVIAGLGGFHINKIKDVLKVLLK